MSGFYAGQRVVCVPTAAATGGALEAIRNKVVTILRVTNSCHAGVLVEVRVDGFHTSCLKCNKSYGGEFYNPANFRPIDSLTEQMDRIEEEGAPVELEPEYA